MCNFVITTVHTHKKKQELTHPKYIIKSASDLIGNRRVELEILILYECYFPMVIPVYVEHDRYKDVVLEINTELLLKCYMYV